MTTFIISILLLFVKRYYSAKIESFQSNNYSNSTSKHIGSWHNWMTNYRVNDKHDGYLDIDSIEFNPLTLYLTYSVHIDCTSKMTIFADAHIYCTSNNSLLSYFAENGSLSFFYLTISRACIQNPAFSQYQSSLSCITNSFCKPSSSSTGSSLTFYLFNASSGDLLNEQSNNSKIINPSTYTVGSQNGYVYYTVSNPYSNTWTKLYAYDINEYTFFESSYIMSFNPSSVPVICGDTIIVSGEAETYSFTKAPELSYTSRGSPDSSPPIPVCMKNANGYRVITRSYAANICYVHDVTNLQSSLSSFDCTTLPIIHYDQDTGNPDIAIMGTSIGNQIIVVQIDGDKVNTKELWFDNGDMDYCFIVKNYFVTAWREGASSLPQIVYFRIYDIKTGKIIWKYEFDNISSTATISVFGGLIQSENDDMHLMIMIRIGQILYAYRERDTD